MSINKKCLAVLQGLGLPMTVSVNGRDGKKLTDARIDPDGSITDLKTGKQYDQPSALRADLIEPNGPTYKRLVYQGTDLHTLGVKP